ncbi:hypothetical protein ACIQWR_37015 [Streptomyces sp. NPDC098789]|uniref:hypothetical protein n=1 Tax=Streptomyces sp. NPDC098789 TaxID=3366098 RepID=UPI003825CCFB
MTTALSPAPAAGAVCTAPATAPALEPAVDPTRAPGVGGPSLAAARPDPADLDPHRALRALAHWRVEGREAARFPYRAVLGHYRAVGKNEVGAELLGALRAVAPATPDGAAARLLADWLPQVVDGAQGDYDSYLGTPVYASLAASGSGSAAASLSASGAGARTEQVITALLADVVAVEAATLVGAPAGRARTRAALRALTAAAGLPAGCADAAGPQAAPDDPAELVRACADAVAAARDAVPADVLRAVELTLTPTTRCHDEQMFIRIIQVFEAVFAAVARSIGAATDAVATGRADLARELLTDATRQVTGTSAVFRVLTTMPKDAFAVIRANTDGRSAVQSIAYRTVEQSSPELHRALLRGPLAEEELHSTMRKLDDSWGAMKRTHWGITMKVIGKVRGTGGTAGASYLRDAAEARLFPALGPAARPSVGVQ